MSDQGLRIHPSCLSTPSCYTATDAIDGLDHHRAQADQAVRPAGGVYALVMFVSHPNEINHNAGQ